MDPTKSASFIPFYDMAVEAGQFLRGEDGEIPGVRETVVRDGFCEKTAITILDQNGARALKRPPGRYVTIDAKAPLDAEGADRAIVRAVGQTIAAMLPKDPGASVLVCGVGNAKIASDALGSTVTSKLIATRSFLQNETEYEEKEDFTRSVALFSPGVFGNTGIESAEMIHAAAKAIRPKALIVIDALATASFARLGTSIQITDTGLSPGGGIGNRRPAVNADTAGVPVIAVGVPTVIYPQSIVGDAFSRLKAEMAKQDKTAAPLCWEAAEEKLYDLLRGEMELFAVTPKDIDVIVNTVARLLAGGIETALHEEITAENYRTYLIG